MLFCICLADKTNELHRTHKKQKAPRISELCLKAYASCVMTYQHKPHTPELTSTKTTYLCLRVSSAALLHQAPQAPPPQPDLSHGESFLRRRVPRRERCYCRRDGRLGSGRKSIKKPRNGCSSFPLIEVFLISGKKKNTIHIQTS